MTKASDFLFRMVLVARKGGDYNEDDPGEDWIVNASLQKLRSGKLRASLTAENALTLEKLTYPRHADKIISILPDEFWPDFIKSLCSDVPAQQQPALPVETPVKQPHSRACGPHPHEHGTMCHENCPTCHGKG